MFRKHLLFISIFWSFAVNGQIKGLPQNTLLKSNNIRKIETKEVFIGSSGDFEKEILLTVELINKEGYITETRFFEDSLKIRAISYKYKNDSLLVENKSENFKNPIKSKAKTCYAYKKNKIVNKYVYSKTGELIFEIKYFYSRKGRLKKIIEITTGDPDKGAINGEVVRTFKYNSNDQILEEKIQGRTKSVFAYKYDKENRLISKHVLGKDEHSNYTIKKIGYDKESRVDSIEEFSEFTSTRRIRKSKSLVKTNPGESYKTQYHYNDQGFIQEKRISSNHELKVILRYKYIR